MFFQKRNLQEFFSKLSGSTVFILRKIIRNLFSLIQNS